MAFPALTNAKLGLSMPSRFGPYWPRPVCSPIAVVISSHSMCRLIVECSKSASGGAGTAHRMPEGIEYLHCVQAAVDDMGLRYQVLDTTGTVRESLHWPMPAPPHQHWRTLVPGEHEAPILGRLAP